VAIPMVSPKLTPQESRNLMVLSLIHEDMKHHQRVALKTVCLKHVPAKYQPSACRLFELLTGDSISEAGVPRYERSQSTRFPAPRAPQR
jgi:hypothetical protein